MKSTLTGTTLIGVSMVATMGMTGVSVAGNTPAEAYHVTADVQDAETAAILSDPELAADVRAGLEQLAQDKLTTFEDVFGEPL